MLSAMPTLAILATLSVSTADEKENVLVVEDEAFWGRRVLGAFEDGASFSMSMSMTPTPTPTPTEPPKPATIELVADINPGRFSSFPSGFTEYGGYLYFKALEEATGIELWRTNGNETTLFADINPGIEYSNPGNGEFGDYFEQLNGELYFSAFEESAGRELWKTNGDTETARAFDIIPGPTGSDPAAGGYTELDSFLYFTIRELIDPRANTYRHELWRMDGVEVEFVRRLRESFSVVELVAFDGFIYFQDRDDETSWGLWRTDGIDSTLVAAINPDGFARISDFTEFNGYLYFQAVGKGFSGTTQLWRTDGDETKLFADLDNPTAFTELNGYLYFQAGAGDFRNKQLWRTDGVETELVSDILFSSIQVQPFTELKGFLYFSAEGRGDPTGLELWRTNGVETMLVADINPGSSGSDPIAFTPFGDYLYFAANDGTLGVEVWRTDGAETALVADINPGKGSSSPFQFTELAGYLYFRANDNSNGIELWRLTV